MSQEISSGATIGLPHSDKGRQTVTALVENEAGVLARVVGLFARRGFNIYSLNVAPTQDERFSRITFVYDKNSAPVEQVISQVNKLVNVISIEAVSGDDSVEREMLMVSLRTGQQTRSEVMDLVTTFEGSIVDVGYDAITVMLAGRPDRLDSFEELICPYGILQMQRSGPVSMKGAMKDLDTHIDQTSA